jgi:hypothetical protein
LGKSHETLPWVAVSQTLPISFIGYITAHRTCKPRERDGNFDSNSRTRFGFEIFDGEQKKGQQKLIFSQI